jgi:hypothetical protein
MKIKIMSVVAAFVASFALAAPAHASVQTGMQMGVQNAPAADPVPKPIKKPVQASGAQNRALLVTPDFHYAGGYQYPSGIDYPTSGTKGISVHASNSKPYINANTYHDLFEVAIESRDQQQRVEVGHTVDLALNGSSNPYLFTFHWVNGVPSTCYNGCGLVDNPTETVDAGDSVTYTPTGTNPTTVYDYEIVRSEILYPAPATKPTWAPAGTGHGWVIRYQKVGDPDNEIGMYPDTLWTGASTPVTFNKVGLFQAFSEIAELQGNPPCSDSGSGIFAYNNAVPPAPNAGAAWVKAFGYHNASPAVTPDFTPFVNPAGNSPGNVRVYDYGTASTPDPDSIRYGGPMNGGVLGGC